LSHARAGGQQHPTPAPLFFYRTEAPAPGYHPPSTNIHWADRGDNRKPGNGGGAGRRWTLDGADGTGAAA
jgi:hypothetical protein